VRGARREREVFLSLRYVLESFLDGDKLEDTMPIALPKSEEVLEGYDNK